MVQGPGWGTGFNSNTCEKSLQAALSVCEPYGSPQWWSRADVGSAWCAEAGTAGQHWAEWPLPEQHSLFLVVQIMRPSHRLEQGSCKMVNRTKEMWNRMGRREVDLWATFNPWLREQVPELYHRTGRWALSCGHLQFSFRDNSFSIWSIPWKVSFERWWVP